MTDRDPALGLSQKGDRYFHLEKTIFRGGDGVTFLSTHYAYLVRKQASSKRKDYVIDISVTLPELEQGNLLSEETTLALDSWALTAIER